MGATLCGALKCRLFSFSIVASVSVPMIERRTKMRSALPSSGLFETQRDVGWEPLTRRQPLARARGEGECV
jgi:hypothetical protein